LLRLPLRAGLVRPPVRRYNDRSPRVRATTDAAGNYEFRDIAPGEYRIYAWEPGDLPLSRDANFRQTYEAQSVAVTMAPGDRLSVPLKTVAVAG